MPNVKAFIGVTKLTLERYAPEILTGVGLVAMGGGTVLACRQTPKAIQILETSKECERIINDTAKTAKANGGKLIRDGKEIEYTENDHKKDIVINRVNCGKDLGKTYGPSALLWVGGALCVCSGVGILRGRNTILAGAAITAEETIRRYRKKVVEMFGEETDKKLRFGEVLSTEVKEKTDPETGEITQEEVTVSDFDPMTVADDDPRAFLFNSDNSQLYVGNLLYDLNTIKCALRACQLRYDLYGNCTVNYARVQLGGKEIPEGVDHGWVKDGNGDGRIDFGLFDAEGEALPWVYKCISEGHGIPVEFNIDGNIKALLARPRNAIAVG